ncbi:hypothetical protein RQN30_03865 [Arcanobacterium hippocoleae]
MVHCIFFVEYERLTIRAPSLCKIIFTAGGGEKLLNVWSSSILPLVNGRKIAKFG